MTTPQGGPEGARSLYDRLGGVYAIAVVVDDFIDEFAVPKLERDEIFAIVESTKADIVRPGAVA